MSSTVIGLFDDYNDAHKAMSSLVAAGIPQDNISLTANRNATGYDGTEMPLDAADYEVHTSGTSGNALRGAFAGGAGGFLAGVALLAIPGVGPIIAAGPLLAAMAGAGLGAATGGLIGALNNAGIPEEDAALYAEAIRRGGTLLTVYTDAAHSARVSTIMDEFGAVDIDERRNYYQGTGYNGFREDAPEYTSEQIANERSRYTTAVPVATAMATDTVTVPATTTTTTMPTTIPAGQPEVVSVAEAQQPFGTVPLQRSRARVHPRAIQTP